MTGTSRQHETKTMLDVHGESPMPCVADATTNPLICRGQLIIAGILEPSNELEWGTSLGLSNLSPN
jgi:hypothetical protein